MIRSSILLCFLIIICSCEEEFISADEINQSKTYTNLSVGREWEYAYDSTLYLNSGGNRVKSSGFMRVKVEDKVDSSRYNISIAYKKLTNQNYEVRRLERIDLTSKSLTLTDESLPFIKLVFPTEKNLNWEGNRLFNADRIVKINDEDMQVYAGWTYTYANIDSTITFDNKPYPKSLVIESGISQSNLINRRLQREVYAPGIGLVSRRFEVLNTQRIEPNTAWADKALSGFIYQQQLISVK
jgi:hypothetical protein